MTDSSPTHITPNALEQLLMQAASDDEFKEELLCDRIAAASRRGLALSVSEQATLAAIPEAQLRVMIDNIPLAAEAERMLPEATLGIRPGEGFSKFSAEGIRPEDGSSLVSQGVRPDIPSPVRGIRPAHLLIGAAAVTTVVLTAGSMCLVAGSRPDSSPQSASQSLRTADLDATQGGSQDGAQDGEVDTQRAKDAGPPEDE